MGRLVRVNISLDDSHSLDDFPVDLYSGLTSGDTTNLVFANIVSSDIPFNLEFEDEDINVSTDPNNPFTPYVYLRISSDGCYDEIIKLNVPRVDCDLCVDFQEIITEPTATPTNTPTNTPTPTPTSIPPTATEEPTPTPTPTSTDGPTPTQTSTPTPTPTPTATEITGDCNVYTMNITAEEYTRFVWTNCDGTSDEWANVGSGSSNSVCALEPGPSVVEGSGYVLTGASCVNYKVERCNDSQPFTIAKTMSCSSGLITDPNYQIGDVVQFRLFDGSNCYGATYCGTITSTSFNGPYNALLSRIPIIPDCDDTLHCTE